MELIPSSIPDSMKGITCLFFILIVSDCIDIHSIKLHDLDFGCGLNICLNL